jgi:hypothetical protein
VINILVQAGVPLGVIELVHEFNMPNLERLSDAVEHNFSRPEDKDLFPPIIMLIGRLSKHQVVPFVFPEPLEPEEDSEEDSNELSPCTRVSQKHRCATCTDVWGRRRSRIDGQEHKPGTARAQPGGTTFRPGWAPDVMLGAEARRGHGHEESGATRSVCPILLDEARPQCSR